jgi:hypothetical protein
MVKYSDYETIVIRNRLYKKCVKSSKEQWGNSKKDKYGVGIINTDGDKYKTFRWGKLGESGFGVRYDVGEPEWKFVEFGDKGEDFIIGNFNRSLDIKMSKLIQVESKGIWLGLKSDIYVIGEIDKDYRSEEEAVVKLKGFITKIKIEKLVKEGKIVKEVGVGGNDWKNYKITTDMLSPLPKLETWIKKHRKKKNIVDNSTIEPVNCFFKRGYDDVLS